ncbi:MAG: hypothetical protein H6R15_3384 [Proteobacteria bacterium]|nr:hypothetical protein [Pseudomonadota bacterium]
MTAEQAQAAIGAALCETGQRIDAWSRLFTAIALLACVLPAPCSVWPFLLVGILLAGLAQVFYALRTGFDRAIFAHWLAQPENTAITGLAAFDQALLVARLAKRLPERTLGERVAGVRRLVLGQLLALGGQIAGTLGAAALLLLR